MPDSGLRIEEFIISYGLCIAENIGFSKHYDFTISFSEEHAIFCFMGRKIDYCVVVFAYQKLRLLKTC